MPSAKAVIKKVLAMLGYELRRLSGQPAMLPVQTENFANLALAYEMRLNDDENLICENANRPRLLARLSGTPPSEAYFLIQALLRTRDIPGDVCEFGVAQGETSALIANEIASSGSKRLHLFDSFEGLPKPSEKDRLKDDLFDLGSIEAYAGTMSFPEAWVRGRLDALGFPASRYEIHKGWIERVLDEDKVVPKSVSFAYVDFDFYEPIRAALRFIHDTASRGAVIIVDDYDFFSTGAKSAVDEFLEETGGHGAAYDIFVPDPRYGHFAVLTRKGSFGAFAGISVK